MHEDEDKIKEQLIQELADLRRRVREAEDALHCCTAELKQSREEFKTFAYIVSHDLRNPLINLKGFATELRSALETIQPAIDLALPHLQESERQAVIAASREDVAEALSFIESSVASIDSFINAVLKLSRLSRREFKFEPIDMKDLVRGTLRSLAAEIERHHAKVAVGSLPEVIADKASMEEVMESILKNAVIYLSPGRPGKIEVTGERGPHEAVIRVRDNGRGIAEEDVHKVFEPFRRAGRQDVPGEGMGLSYVRVLLRGHGGRLWCESELGVGTTFAFAIPNRLEKGEGHDAR